MKRIGLTGGFGSGKSTVVAMLRDENVPIIDTDEIARKLTGSNSDILLNIKDKFGPEMLHADGTLNRTTLADHVFQKASALKQLNALMHPAIETVLTEELNHLENQGCTWAIIDVPLLYETGWDREMDAVIVVWAPNDICIRRLKEHRGYTQQQITQRIGAQWPLDEKKARADYLIDNSGSKKQTLTQLHVLLKKLQEDFPHAP